MTLILPWLMVQSPSDHCHSVGKQGLCVCLFFIDQCSLHSPLTKRFLMWNGPPVELNEPEPMLSGHPVTVSVRKCRHLTGKSGNVPFPSTDHDIHTHQARGLPKREGMDWLLSSSAASDIHPQTPSPRSHLPPPHHLSLLRIPSLAAASVMQVEAWPKIWGDEWLPSCWC